MFGFGALRNQGNGAAIFSNTVALASGNSSIGTDGGNITLGGQVTGAGALTKINANTLTLSGADNYTAPRPSALEPCKSATEPRTAASEPAQ